jgi:hypothetical protein
VNGLSDSVAWPSRDPEWVTKCLLTGLISLIPIVGLMVLYGWLLTALDNLRGGRQVLPPAGFSYIGRGVGLFVVYLVYALALIVVFAAFFGLGLGVILGTNGRAGAFGTLWILLGYGLLLVAALGLILFSPAIILGTDRSGIGGGLNVPAILARVGADFNNALSAGLFALVANLIGQVGSLICCIGAIFTVPYGYAVLAGVVYNYERSTAPVA